MDSPLGKTRNVSFEDTTQVKHWFFNFTLIFDPGLWQKRGKNGVAGSTPLFTPTPTPFLHPDTGGVKTPNKKFDPDPGGDKTPAKN